MIASNQHGQSALAPDSVQGTMLTLPDFYLDLMFGDPPVPGETRISPAPVEREYELAVAAT